MKETLHNPGLAAPFYRSSFEVASPTEVLRSRGRIGEIDSKITQAQADFDTCQRLCQEADVALQTVTPDHRKSIELAVAQRQRQIRDVELDLQKWKDLRQFYDSMVRDQEAYVFRFQLRDFLLSGEPAVNPRTLANALAGLPTMVWQRSLARCSDMAFDPPRLEYSIWELVSEIWCDRPEDFEAAPVDFFKDRVLKLSGEYGHPRQFLWDNWWDLKNAIEECWRSPSPRLAGSVPFALTSIFLRYVSRQKDPVERILAQQEKLVPLVARAATFRS